LTTKKSFLCQSAYINPSSIALKLSMQSIKPFNVDLAEDYSVNHHIGTYTPRHNVAVPLRQSIIFMAYAKSQ